MFATIAPNFDEPLKVMYHFVIYECETNDTQNLEQ